MCYAAICSLAFLYFVLYIGFGATVIGVGFSTWSNLANGRIICDNDEAPFINVHMAIIILAIIITATILKCNICENKTYSNGRTTKVKYSCCCCWPLWYWPHARHTKLLNISKYLETFFNLVPRLMSGILGIIYMVMLCTMQNKSECFNLTTLFSVSIVLNLIWSFYQFFTSGFSCIGILRKGEIEVVYPEDVV